MSANLCLALVISVAGQFDEKTRSAVTQLAEIPADAYRPVAKDVVYLSRQPWANLHPERGPITDVVVTLPGESLWKEVVEMTKNEVPKPGENAKLDKLFDETKVNLILVNVKVAVVKVMPEMGGKNGLHPAYPVEIRFLDGPAKGAVVWTGFLNLSRTIDKTTLPILRELETRATFEKKKLAVLKKSRAKAIRNAANEVSSKQMIENELKLAPYRAAMQTEALRQQSQLMEMQATQARLRNLQELNQLIRQSRVQQQMSNGGVMFGPNGPILPGDPLPLPTRP